MGEVERQAGLYRVRCGAEWLVGEYCLYDPEIGGGDWFYADDREYWPDEIGAFLGPAQVAPSQ